MIVTLLLLVMGQDAKPASPIVQFPDFAVSGYDPFIDGKVIGFKIQVKNTSDKAVRFGSLSLFRKGFEYNNDGYYVISPYDTREDGKKNNEIEIGTDYLTKAQSELLYPNDTMIIRVEITGANFPVKNLAPSFIFAREIGGPQVIFFMDQKGKNLTLQARDPRQEEKRLEDEKKELAKKNEEKAAVERAARNAETQKKIIPIKASMAKIQPEVDRLDKAYRELAKKANAADKADQFEDAKKFKAESLKGYADWKKEKAKLDTLNAELKRLVGQIEP